MTKPNESDAGPKHPPLLEAKMGEHTVVVQVTPYRLEAIVNGRHVVCFITLSDQHNAVNNTNEDSANVTSTICVVKVKKGLPH